MPLHVLFLFNQLVKSCVLVILTNNRVSLSLVLMKVFNATSFTSRKTIAGPMLQLGRKNSRWEEKGGGSAANCPYNGFPGLHQAISFSPASSLSGNTLHKYILAFYHFLFYVYIGCQYCVNNQFDNFALLSQMQVSGILTTTNNFFCGENITYLMFNLSNADIEL